MRSGLGLRLSSDELKAHSRWPEPRGRPEQPILEDLERKVRKIMDTTQRSLFQQRRNSKAGPISSRS
jgi:hypothetical protein